ncbi:MAG: hypothetical protein HUU49_04870 [Candidatus Buchananbacteria bacterium]|nr:hypothetical protein [Candidatus Buchananbacteria bacterium]
MKQICAIVLLLAVGCSTVTPTGRAALVAKQNADSKYWVGYQAAELHVGGVEHYTDSNQNFVEAWMKARANRDEAVRQFWELQGESYWKALPDLNADPSATLPRGPFKFYRGVLYNASSRPVRFEVSYGQFALVRTIGPGAKEWTFLPADRYYVQLYRAGSSSAYLRGWRDIDTVEADNQVEGFTCDWSIVAP